MDIFLLLFSFIRVLLRAVLLLLLLFLRVCSKVNLCLLNVCGICAPCFSSFTSCLVHALQCVVAVYAHVFLVIFHTEQVKVSWLVNVSLFVFYCAGNTFKKRPWVLSCKKITRHCIVDNIFLVCQDAKYL